MSSYRNLRSIGALAIGLASGGCATIPEAISTPVAGPTIQEVRAHPQSRIDKKVRWGGTVVEMRNLKSSSEVTVVARPLSDAGEPLGDRASTGRFIAVIDGFLEPEEYQSGRRITVVGRIDGTRTSKIGEYVYDYPVVQARHLYLWPAYVERQMDPYPYWYHNDPFWNPFWDPFWPHWGPYYGPDPFYHPWWRH